MTGYHRPNQCPSRHLPTPCSPCVRPTCSLSLDQLQALTHFTPHPNPNTATDTETDTVTDLVLASLALAVSTRPWRVRWGTTPARRPRDTPAPHHRRARRPLARRPPACHPVGRHPVGRHRVGRRQVDRQGPVAAARGRRRRCPRLSGGAPPLVYQRGSTFTMRIYLPCGSTNYGSTHSGSAHSGYTNTYEGTHAAGAQAARPALPGKERGAGRECDARVGNGPCSPRIIYTSPAYVSPEHILCARSPG